ncbi:hypothetical protein GTP91_01375 [Rugamonas sp. FT82W]|uniref:Uncharacterized protein n=1 Tax=Duganella vulcania TaxID=2692166 RepID=A0A845FTS4_9BURK|nr:hypothetical protein [Duganella vulcania]MYM85823.1 hypothetical protein [Duganella vulcania]
MMTLDELNANLALLIQTYIPNPADQHRLLEQAAQVSSNGAGVKGLLARLDPWLAGVATPEHAGLVKDIYFCYC